MVLARTRANRRGYWPWRATCLEPLWYEGTSVGLLQIRGAYEDHVRYAIISSEWEERRAQIENDFLS